MAKNYCNMAGTVLGLSLLISGIGPAGAAVKQGEALPAFQVQAQSGEVINQQTFDGKVPGVIYLFKSQNCPSCSEGLGQLKEVGSQQAAKDFQIVAISKDDTTSVGEGVTFPVMVGDQEVFSTLSPSLLPTTVLVGPEGKVSRVIQGGGKHVGDLLAALAENQLQQKKSANARKLYIKASKGGTSVVARSGVAFSYLKEGNVQEAERDFREMAGGTDRQLQLQGREGLAEVLFQQGKYDEALKTAEAVLKEDSGRVMAGLVKGKALSAKGNVAEAEKVLTVATADTASADFSWQKAEANLALGNLQMGGKHSQIALKSYQRASGDNPYYAEALSNEGVALKEMGEPEKAMEVFQKLQKVDPSDKLVHALLRQAQEAIAQKQDLEKQKYIDGVVKDLLKQFKEQKKTASGSGDDWTSPVIAVSILGFQNHTGGMLTGRIGVEGILQDELTREMQGVGIKVVERAVLDKLLAELKMGSSELADPDTALKLGKIMAARMIATGSLYSTPGGLSATIRLVDTETTGIVLSLAEKDLKSGDPLDLAPKFAKAVQKAVAEKYPLKGRIAEVEGDQVMINLGKRHGVQTGARFNVVGDGKPIELNGKILGYKPVQLGNLEVTTVEDQMSYAKVAKKGGDLAKNQKIIQQQGN